MVLTSLQQQFRKSVNALPAAEHKRVLEALDDAIAWHDGQKRNSGEPYVIHPITVAMDLVELDAPSDILIAALLHDVVEDNRATLADVRGKYGDTVAKLVDGVTKLTKSRYEGHRAERQVASLRKMLLSAHDDLRIILIKLADRRHNIRTLDIFPENKQKRIAHETLDIYVPFARMMGLWDLKQELENSCFPIVYPEESAVWKQAIQERREDLQPEREEFVHNINAHTSQNVEASLHVMTDYEVYRKLEGNSALLQRSNNMDSVNIVVDAQKSVDCYRVLGDIHTQYVVRSTVFRDYISIPQSNGYQALHTTVFLSHKHELRLRIQTRAMHEHTMRRKVTAWGDHEEKNVYQSLQHLHVAPADTPSQYLEDLKQGVLAKRINVFTSSGMVLSLPEGATGIDFAFASSPDQIPYLSGIRIDGELLDVTHVLKDGDTVELVWQNQGAVLRMTWLEKVKSVAARERLRKSLKRAPPSRRKEYGSEILQMELQKRRLPIWPVFHVPAIKSRLVAQVHKGSFGDMLMDMGSGSLAVHTVVSAYEELIRDPQGIAVRLLKWLHLLPRTRVLNREAALIDIEIYAQDRTGLVYDISRCIAERGINMSRFTAYALPAKGAMYKIQLECESFEQFSELYDALHNVQNVTKVLRKK